MGIDPYGHWSETMEYAQQGGMEESAQLVERPDAKRRGRKRVH